MQRFVQVDQAEQMVQRAFADLEARVGERCVTPRLHVHQAPKPEWSGGKERAPMRIGKRAARQSEIRAARSGLLTQAPAQ